MSELNGMGCVGAVSANNVGQEEPDSAVLADVQSLNDIMNTGSLVVGGQPVLKSGQPAEEVDVPGDAQSGLLNNAALGDTLGGINSSFRYRSASSESSSGSGSSKRSLAEFIIEETSKIDMKKMYEMAQNRKPGEPNPMQQLTSGLAIATQGVDIKMQIDKNG